MEEEGLEFLWDDESISEQGEQEAIVSLTSIFKAIKKETKPRAKPKAKPAPSSFKVDKRVNNFKNYHQEIRKISEEHRVSITIARKIYKNRKNLNVEKSEEEKIEEPSSSSSSENNQEKLVPLSEYLIKDSNDAVKILDILENQYYTLTFYLKDKEFLNEKIPLIKDKENLKCMILNYIFSLTHRINKEIYNVYYRNIRDIMNPNIKELFKTFYNYKFNTSLTWDQIHNKVIFTNETISKYTDEEVFYVISLLNSIHESCKTFVVRFGIMTLTK